MIVLTEDAVLDELAQIQVESIGWIPLVDGAYLHVSDENTIEIQVVGIPKTGDAVLLVGYA